LVGIAKSKATTNGITTERTLARSIAGRSLVFPGDAKRSEVLVVIGFDFLIK
jgi:hypothetical protein